MTRSKET